MSRKHSHNENWRVEVMPAAWSYQTEKVLQRTCEDIAKAIKRHIDDVADVAVVCDPVYVCEHCGQPWTEHDKDYNGGCCEKDQAAEDARNPPAELIPGVAAALNTLTIRPYQEQDEK